MQINQLKNSLPKWMGSLISPVPAILPAEIRSDIVATTFDNLEKY